MESQKYLVIVTLIDGQNFTVPDGAPDKIDATVFAEARFGNESILRSDPIKLVNSNPEFVTELAWQLDKKSLHQLRVERKSIKLQVFMQTCEKKRKTNCHSSELTNGQTKGANETHKVELIGYTILDIRSAQQREHPKFQWLPLLNPKFRKSSYNRPEIQLAIILSRSDDDSRDDPIQFPSVSSLPDQGSQNKSLECINDQNNDINGHTEKENTSDTRLYTTCLDISNQNSVDIEKDEIIDNDIVIRSKDRIFYVYDTSHPHKSSLEDCDERYKLTITIPFSSGLGNLVREKQGKYFFSVNLFGATFRTRYFDGLNGTDSKEIQVNVRTTHAGVLATYFELYANLDINLYKISGESLGMATLQLNQLCSLDTKCRSIEGIFAMQPMNDSELDTMQSAHPTIGVSVVLEKLNESNLENGVLKSKHHQMLAREHLDDEIDEFLTRTFNFHQLTTDGDNLELNESNLNSESEVIVEDLDGPRENDHHFCFTIDLKKFSYTLNQRLIPTLRELVIRYSYPFFGYKETITTDSSIPINETSSIIVSGFCEFNFATTTTPLLTALRELPLILEVLASDDSRLKHIGSGSSGRVIATCEINLANSLGLDEENINTIKEEALSKSSSVPIFALDGEEIGQLQIYLCLKDLGKPSQKFKASIESLNEAHGVMVPNETIRPERLSSNDLRRLDSFICEAKQNFETWKEEYSNRLSEEIRRRDNERFKRLYQRIEAKETKRDQEFKKKIDELSGLEKKFKNSLACVETLEKMLADGLKQMKAKNAILNTRIDMLNMKISQVTPSNSKTETRRTKEPAIKQAQREKKNAQ